MTTDTNTAAHGNFMQLTDTEIDAVGGGRWGDPIRPEPIHWGLSFAFFSVFGPAAMGLYMIKYN